MGGTPQTPSLPALIPMDFSVFLRKTQLWEDGAAWGLTHLSPGTTSKEPGEEGGHLCALCTDAAPWLLCTSFWISQRLSPKIVLNGRVSCRDAHLWLVNGAGWQEQTSRGGSVSARACQSAAARRSRLLARCFTCHERALVT